MFLIDEQLEFRVGELEGEPAFRWRDIHGDVNDLYEFIALGTNKPTSSFFESCMYKAMWERKFSRSAEASRRSVSERTRRPAERLFHGIRDRGDLGIGQQAYVTDVLAPHHACADDAVAYEGGHCFSFRLKRA